MNRTAVVTGGSSGVGRATAIRLAKEGWRVAIVGTREDALNETIKLSGKPDQMLAAPAEGLERFAQRGRCHDVQRP